MAGRVGTRVAARASSLIRTTATVTATSSSARPMGLATSAVKARWMGRCVLIRPNRVPSLLGWSTTLGYRRSTGSLTILRSWWIPPLSNPARHGNIRPMAVTPGYRVRGAPSNSHRGPVIPRTRFRSVRSTALVILAIPPCWGQSLSICLRHRLRRLLWRVTRALWVME